MTIGSAIQSLLVADAGVAALVGARVWAETVPEQSGYPAITIQQTGGAPIHGVRDDLTWATAQLQIDVLAQSKASALATSAAVKAALARYRGTVGATVIDDVLLEQESHDYWPEQDIRRVTLDWLIYYSE